MHAFSMIMLFLSCFSMSAVVIGFLYVSYLRYRLHAMSKSRHSLRLFTQGTGVIAHSEHKKRRDARIVEIAMIIPNHESARGHKHQFITAMRDKVDFMVNFTEYNIQGDYLHVEKVVERVFQENYDLIYTQGEGILAIVHKMSVLRKKTIPVVFCGPREIFWNDLQKQHPTPWMTGLVGHLGHKIRFPIFLESKPHLKKVLHLYVQEFVSKQTYDEIVDIFKQYKVDYIMQPINSGEGLMSALEKHRHEIDSVITSRDIYSSSVAHRIGAFCSKHGITFFSSNLSNVRKDASVCVSLADINMGGQVADKAIAILQHGKNPSEVPVSIIPEDAPYEIYFNTQAMQKQDVKYKDIERVMLRYGKYAFIGPYKY